MRIVSQDGIYDLPYEMAIIHCVEMCEGKCFITAELNVAKCNIAEYSTKKKALKAMEMLKTQCKRLETIKCFIQGNEVNDKACGFKETVLEIRNSHIFQFPKDEDVEV